LPDGGTDFLANVAAFVPLGLLIRRARAGVARTTAVGALLSVTIELLQGTGIAGRTAVLGDVLANSLGTAAGAVLAAAGAILLRPTPSQARGLATATALAWVLLMTASAWLLGRPPADGPRPPRAHARPTVPGMGWYSGHVTAFAVDAWVAGPGDLPRGGGPLVVAAALGAESRVRLALEGSDARGTFVPAAAILDGALEPALLVGQRGDAAEVHVRTRARRWRLREAPLVVPGLLAPTPGPNPAVAQLHVTFAAGRVTFVGAATRPSTSRRATTQEAAPTRGWTLVLPLGRPWGPEALLLDALWTGTLVAPLGYWLRRAAPGKRALAAGAVGAAVLLIGLVGGPALAGAPTGAGGAAEGAAWAGALGALLAGVWRGGALRLPHPPAPVSLQG
jgi:hypothetical protein